MPDTTQLMYGNLAAWWPLLSPPDHYVEEAALYRQLLDGHSATPPRTVLELGSGGGSNAFHLKQHYALTLVDLSPGMLANSRAINPECEHVQGDMRTVRLNRTFDAVFMHDALDYMTTLDDLRRAIETASLHCKPGGVLLLVPDYVRESFVPYTSHGGEDGAGRAMRYLEWVWDPDPGDHTYVADYAFMLRDESGQVRCEHDRHLCGLFSRAEWQGVLRESGFTIQASESPIAGDGGQHQPVFIGVK